MGSVILGIASNRFVCGDADKPLPFVADSFGRGLCSDAFRLFRNKAEVLEEVERCAPQSSDRAAASRQIMVSN